MPFSVHEWMNKNRGFLNTITSRAQIQVNTHAQIQDGSIFISCVRAKTIQNRNVRTRIFLKTEQKISVFKQNRIRVDGTRVQGMANYYRCANDGLFLDNR